MYIKYKLKRYARGLIFIALLSFLVGIVHPYYYIIPIKFSNSISNDTILIKPGGYATFISSYNLTKLYNIENLKISYSYKLPIYDKYNLTILYYLYYIRVLNIGNSNIYIHFYGKVNIENYSGIYRVINIFKLNAYIDLFIGVIIYLASYIYKEDEEESYEFINF